MRVKFQRESDGRIVAQLPGYVLPIVTATGWDKAEAVAGLCLLARLDGESDADGGNHEQG